MVVFTFVNNGQAGGYFMAADRTAMGWRELPYDLDRQMEDVRRKGEEVEEVSVGLNGDWFLRTNCRHACKTEHARADLISNVEKFMELLQQAGLSLVDYGIQFFTFVPDQTGYVTVLHKMDGSLTRCAWHNVPQELDGVLEREGPKGVRHVTVGVNGAYVVILNSGAVWWGAGVPGRLHQLLEDAEKRGRSVTTVSLSLVSPSWYFVQFADGATDFSLPPDWHRSVNHYSAQAKRASTAPRMATSYNHGAHRTQTYPQYAPQLPQAQFGSFTPGGLVPASPQKLVYNVTNVYNAVSQQAQQHSTTSGLEKYNGMFHLLGNTLKLAGTVLGPTLRKDWGNFTGNGGNYTSNGDNYLSNGDNYSGNWDNYTSNGDNYSGNWDNYSDNWDNNYTGN